MGYFIQRRCVRSLGWWLTEQGLIPHTPEARPRGPCVGRVVPPKASLLDLQTASAPCVSTWPLLCTCLYPNLS